MKKLFALLIGLMVSTAAMAVPSGDYQTGIVVPSEFTNQIILFPYVSIYVFKTSIIEKHLPNTVEIISSKTFACP